MEFRRRRRISNIIITLWLVVPALLIAAGIAASVIEAARYPWMDWSSHGYWVLALFSIPGIIYGFYLLARSMKYRRSMNYYRVFQDEIYRFEREYRHGDRKRYGKTVLTEHWLFSYYAASTCLLPLKEAVWIYSTMFKSRSRYRGVYWTCGIKVHYRNGTILHIKCEKNQLDRAMGVFAERCSKAQFGYSEEQEKAWKEGAKRWRISQ